MASNPNNAGGSPAPTAADRLRAGDLAGPFHKSGSRGVMFTDNGQEKEQSIDFRLSSYDGEDGQEDETLIHCPTLRSELEARPSPFLVHQYHGGGFVSDADRVCLQSIKFAHAKSAGSRSQDNLMELRQMSRRYSQDYLEDGYMPLPDHAMRSGPRETIYFNPKDTHVAICTVGGICPGLNDVVRAMVHKLLDYGVPEANIMGIRYGFKGFYDRKHKPVTLTRRMVEEIHLEGGTILGTSRGLPNVPEIVKRLDLWKIDHLYVVGGRGGQAAAESIHRECRAKQVPCCVVAVPKSIDNDFMLVDKTFGFETAVEEAQKAILAAKVEASSAYQGVGIVKLMGRQSGFITVQASLAAGIVDAVLIPEVRFTLEGDHGLLAYLQRIMEEKGHCVVCVAEGAGQDLIPDPPTPLVDNSGRPKLKDVGAWLKRKFKEHWKEADIKYIEPTYMIRSIPTIAGDRVYCKMLAHGAVHGAFAGFTGITVGLVNTHYCYLPIPLIIQAPRRVDPNGELWNRLRSSCGQPNFSKP
ncbi:phosphofructokinase family isoform B [Chlorella sorokiniana]|uniref:Phosphofructokinase family isoform B n=1 Tax=Chlorella sorokiniana TaxID=3076 RepID=A0A2P6TPT3_CHLSO|nr:phosphofructokinase family isoform B [Chlorella sorokiniana]|eukprot:PRW56044.1 phosphofructokinase family isoform B [Chlorella sorokiniana]